MTTAMAAALTAVPGVASAGDTPGCQGFVVPAAGETVYVELCLPPEGEPKAVQVLVTPAATSASYWDSTYEPERYSYRRAMLSGGYATLAIDPPGSGRSSHPRSTRVTVDRYVTQVHEIVQALRSGGVGGHGFERVITSGLSNGSLVSVLEAARYHDVDAVILTGFSAPINPRTAVHGTSNATLASRDPRFAERNLGPGYLTFKRDFYERVLLSPNGYDPAVRALQYETRETITGPYLATVASSVARETVTPKLARSRSIDVPVLLALGAEDATICGNPPFGTDCTSAATVRASNTAFYTGAPRLDTFVLPRAGHALNFALNATDWFAHVTAWCDDVLGS